MAKAVDEWIEIFKKTNFMETSIRQFSENNKISQTFVTKWLRKLDIPYHKKNVIHERKRDGNGCYAVRSPYENKNNFNLNNFTKEQNFHSKNTTKNTKYSDDYDLFNNVKKHQEQKNLLKKKK
jgi:hypothetical protein